MFNVGDKVRCINNQWNVDRFEFGITHLLNLGEVYTVNATEGEYVALDKGTWLSERFELVESDTTKVIVLDVTQKMVLFNALVEYNAWVADTLFDQLQDAETITITATFNPSNKVYLFESGDPDLGWFIGRDETEDDDDYLRRDGIWEHQTNDAPYEPEIYYTLRQAKDTAIKFGYEPVVKD